MDNDQQIPVQAPKSGSKLVLFGGAAAVLVAGVLGFSFLSRNKGSSGMPISVSTEQAAAPSTSITLDEVVKHADAKSCFMAVEGNVYDVTSYIPNHPGRDAILQGCGKDATEMFNSRPGKGTSHSNRARDTLLKLKIGVLSGSS
jgi:cytochrome b involved in lipid metabolism